MITSYVSGMLDLTSGYHRRHLLFSRGNPRFAIVSASLLRAIQISVIKQLFGLQFHKRGTSEQLYSNCVQRDLGHLNLSCVVRFTFSNWVLIKIVTTQLLHEREYCYFLCIRAYVCTYMQYIIPFVIFFKYLITVILSLSTTEYLF